MRSRIIDRDEVNDVGRWDFPSVDASAADALRGASKGGAHLLTAGQLDALQRQVHEEAYTRGFDEGLAAGKEELAARAAKLAALAEALAQPLQNLERAIDEELVGLAVTLASHLVRREIDHDPALLRDAVHDCLAVLPSGARDVTLYLHPSDAALVRANSVLNDEARFKLAEDADLARGDVRVTSASSQIDGRLEARLAQILAAARSGRPEDLASASLPPSGPG
jgi:flagellar assembly protein FliH